MSTMTTRRASVASTALAALLALAGCDSKPQAQAPPRPTSASPAPSLPAALFLTSVPTDAKPVEDAKKAAHAGDAITLTGRIGGSDDPFVESRAVFTIMGPGIPACSDNPEDKCKTPWDYCCETPETIQAHQATIQVVDASGAPLKVSLKGEHGLKELSTCTIVGKVVQAEGPVLVVNATGIYIAAK